MVQDLDHVPKHHPKSAAGHCPLTASALGLEGARSACRLSPGQADGPSVSRSLRPWAEDSMQLLSKPCGWNFNSNCCSTAQRACTHALETMMFATGCKRNLLYVYFSYLKIMLIFFFKIYFY